MIKHAMGQGDINFGASSQADSILNNILSSFLSNSLFPPSPAGRLEQLMSPCHRRLWWLWLIWTMNVPSILYLCKDALRMLLYASISITSHLYLISMSTGYFVQGWMHSGCRCCWRARPSLGLSRKKPHYAGDQLCTMYPPQRNTNTYEYR